MVEMTTDWFVKSLMSIIAVIVEFFALYGVIFALDSYGTFVGIDALGYLAIYILPLFVIVFTVYYIFKSDAISF